MQRTRQPINGHLNNFATSFKCYLQGRRLLKIGEHMLQQQQQLESNGANCPAACVAVITAGNIQRPSDLTDTEHSDRVDQALLICAQQSQHGVRSWARPLVRNILLCRKALGEEGLRLMVTQLVLPNLGHVTALPNLQDLALGPASGGQYHEQLPPFLAPDLGPLAPLSALTRLCLSNTTLHNIQGLSALPSLRILSLAKTRWLSDLLPLRGLRLRELDLTSTAVQDTEPLAHMSSLEVLRLNDCKLHSLTPHLPGLRVLSLVGTAFPSGLGDLPGPALEDLDLGSLLCAELTDLTPLTALRNLCTLSLRNVPVMCVAVLSQLTRLRVLNLADTKVSNLGPLRGLRLEELNLSQSRVRDLRPLEAMHSLRLLNAGSCRQLRDLSPLSRLTALESLCVGRFSRHNAATISASCPPLTTLDVIGGTADLAAVASLRRTLHTLLLTRCILPDITALAQLTRLTRLSLAESTMLGLGPLRGLPLGHLDCRGLQVDDLSPLVGMATLTHLDCEGCYRLEDVSPLAGLSRLQHINLRGCIVHNLWPLERLPLQYLDIGGTPVQDLSPLTAVRSLTCLDISEGLVRDLSPLSLLTELQMLATCDGWTEDWRVGSPWSGMVSLQGRLGVCERLDLGPGLTLDARCWLHRDLIRGRTFGDGL